MYEIICKIKYSASENLLRHMVDSWTMPNQVTTIMGRACLATQERLLDEFAKSQAELIVKHVT